MTKAVEAERKRSSVKAWRESLGISPKDVARIMGCAPDNIVHLENGEPQPHQQYAVAEYQRLLVCCTMQAVESFKPENPMGSLLMNMDRAIGRWREEP